jgi:hypothetical protein
VAGTRGRSVRGRAKRQLVRLLVGPLFALAALLGAAPPGADAVPVDTTPTSTRPASGAPRAVELRLADAVQPRAGDVVRSADDVAPGAALATPAWLSRLARPLLVIGLVIVVASIVSILRNI